MTTVSESGKWRRLHPASLAVNLVPRTLRFARAFWPFILIMLFGGGNAETLINGGLLGMFFVVPLSQTLVHFFTLRYRVHNGRLEIESGLLNRQTRVIDPERVQNVELVKNLFQRMAGMVEVRIETASGTEVEGLLSALDETSAMELVNALKSDTVHTEEEDPLANAPIIIQNSPMDLIRYGITVTRIGAAILIVWGLSMEGMQLLDPGDVDNAASIFEGMGGVALAFAVITGGLLAGVGSSVMKHWNFTLREVGDRLVATEGMFTTRQVQIQRNRVQLVSIEEPFLRRLLGFGSIHIETAAARAGAGGIESAEAVIPVVDHRSFSEIVHAALPDLDVALDKADLHPPHRNALIRNLIRSSMQSILVASALTYFVWPWGALAWLLPLATIGVTIMDHRHQGWLVTERYVIARRGWIRRRTLVVARRKLQVLQAAQGPLLRRYGLGQLSLRVPGAVVALPMLGWDEVNTLLDDLTPRGQQT